MGRKVLVGTANGLHSVNGGRDVQLPGHQVRSLIRSDSDQWATVDEGQVWQAGDGGEWRRVASIDTLRANCILMTTSGPLVGTSQARLFALRGETIGLVSSFDEAPGRDKWHTPWGGPPDVRSMSATPAGTLFVNVHVGGVVRSADGGESWEPTIGIDSDVHQVLFEANSGVVLAATARGLAVSTDSGESWSFEVDGLHGTYLRAVAVANETVLVTASTGPYTDRAAVYRKRLDVREPFQRCSLGLPQWFPENIDTHCLAASGPWVAFGTSDGRVFLSSDEGGAWTEAANDLPPARCVALADE